MTKGCYALFLLYLHARRHHSTSYICDGAATRPLTLTLAEVGAPATFTVQVASTSRLPARLATAQVSAASRGTHAAALRMVERHAVTVT